MASEVARVARRLEAAKESKCLGIYFLLPIPVHLSNIGMKVK